MLGGQLIPITPELAASANVIDFHIVVGGSICNTCRSDICKMVKDPDSDRTRELRQQLRLQAENEHRDEEQDIEMMEAPGPAEHSSVPDQSTSSEGSLELLDKPAFVRLLNESVLPLLGVERIVHKDLKSPTYCHDMMDAITRALGKKLFTIAPSNETAQEEMIRQLKVKYAATTDRDDKYRILSVLPKSWTTHKVHIEFGASVKLASSVKKLVGEKDILCVPDKRLATRTLSAETVRCVKDFFLLPEICHTCPGKRDYITVNEDGDKIPLQRRLLLMNLKEAYKVFVEENDCEISFTKFTMLRPPQCILALDGSGIHNVCVCMHHQNVKLIFGPMKNMFMVETYCELLNKMTCDVPNENCYLNKCRNCPGKNEMEQYLEGILNENNMWTVPHKQWIMTDGKRHDFPIKIYLLA